jgi:hypothetical protein
VLGMPDRERLKPRPQTAGDDDGIHRATVS